MKKLQQYQVNFITFSDVLGHVIPPSLDKKYHDDFKNGTESFFVEESCVSRESLSSSWQMDTLARMEGIEDISMIFSIRNNKRILKALDFYNLRSMTKKVNGICVFKFSKELQKNKDLAGVIGQVLDHGIILVHADGSYTKYERYMRSPSAQRAGGAIFCKEGERFPLRNIFSLNVIHALEELKFVPSKWESALALGFTSSHAIKSLKKWKIAIVPDVQRMISVKVKKLAEYSDVELEELKKKGVTPNTNKYDGLDRVKYQVLSKKKDDIQFTLLDEVVETRKIEAIDGCGVAKFEVFEQIFAELGFSEREKLYGFTQQIRAPYVKGMLCAMDIVKFCDENNITTLFDVYGDEFDPRTVDIMIPESMFKGCGLFKHTSEYMDFLYQSFDYKGEEYKMFPQNEWLRIANINKEKEPMREMTYQYLQAMLKLEPNALIHLSQDFIDTIKQGVTSDIRVAKKFLGMIYHSDGCYEKNMVGKAQEMLELCPQQFYGRVIQQALLDVIKTTFWALAKGRIPLHGAYHFIVGDLSLLFVNTPERYARKGKNMILDENDFCLLKKGENYISGFIGESVLYRSPLIHPSEVRKVKFTVNVLCDRYFGHLLGLIMFNSYEVTALCMGGADFDGDKVYKTENPVLLKAYQNDMAIIISPLETYDSSKSKMKLKDIETAVTLSKMDARTLDNQTGIQTNMGTYYISQYYDTRLKYMTALNDVYNAKSPAEIVAVRNRMYWKKIEQNAITTTQQLIDKLNSDMKIKLDEIDYKLTVIRICQAGEIDFPKHGVRFVLPLNVRVNAKLKWKEPEKFNAMNKAREQFNAENAKAIMEGTVKKQWIIVPHDTPLQRLYDHCVSEWNTIKEQLDKQRNLDVNKYALGKDINMAEFNRLYPIVKNIERAYSAEMLTKQAETKDMDKEESNKIFREFFDRYIEVVDSLTNDRKALASVCAQLTFVEKSSGGTSFPFVVAYDGILQNLADWNFDSLRIVPVEELDHDHIIHSGSIIVEDNVATHNATGLIFDYVAPNGIYDIFSVKGKHYIQIPYNLTTDDKKALVENHINKPMINARKSNSVHEVKVVENFEYTFSINGLQHYNQNSKSVLDSLKTFNNCKLVNTVIGDTGVDYVGLEVDGVVVGTISSVNKSKITDKGFINLDNFKGHAIKVFGGAKSGKYAIKDLKGVITTTTVTKSYDLDKYHLRCNLKTWYWNREWVQISQFQGFKFVGVDFRNYKPTVGEIFSRVNLEVNGLLHHVEIIRTETGIDVHSIINATDNSQIPVKRLITNEFGEQVQVYNLHEDLLAGILRACSYFNAKKVLMDIEQEQEEKHQQELEDSLVKVLTKELNLALNPVVKTIFPKGYAEIEVVERKLA